LTYPLNPSPIGQGVVQVFFIVRVDETDGVQLAQVLVGTETLGSS
jgi:hypothetical protein